MNDELERMRRGVPNEATRNGQPTVEKMYAFLSGSTPPVEAIPIKL